MRNGVVVSVVLTVAAVAGITDVPTGLRTGCPPTWHTGDWGESWLGFRISALSFASVPHPGPIFLCSSHSCSLDPNNLDLHQEPPLGKTHLPCSPMLRSGMAPPCLLSDWWNCQSEHSVC